MKRLQAPFDEHAIRSLRAGDLVVVDGDVVITAGLPTHQRLTHCLESGEAPPVELRGQALFHLGGYSQGEGEHFEMLYINPTTSTRFNPYMPTLIEGFGLRVVGGKGGLDEHSVEAMRKVGCVYLSFLGGGCTLLSRAIQRVVEVGWPEMVTHYRLSRINVNGLGPAVVAIDAQGNSLYAQNAQTAGARSGEVLAGLHAQARQGKSQLS
ncbi:MULTISPECIES: fumarate hydratase C-terminal domain-containing protein [Pseudomonas]|uniref:fumarate hydratase C-terminal domain-containing protein n=1 Tax=Pseudomonas TaxID=286 RepID=UPI0013798D1A|nr:MULTISPECIES: fumarate hydratase C-terminal domain-containing protein [Pseudomonas]WBM30503.1 fumarate hydratase C-terminal domain-containing protein [Pseudomonas sp. NY11382]